MLRDDREEAFVSSLASILAMDKVEPMSRNEIKAMFGKRCPEPGRLLEILLELVGEDLLDVSDRVIEREGRIRRVPVYSLPAGRVRLTPRPQSQRRV